jgi:transcriptional regulator with XRE-family HTH domain
MPFSNQRKSLPIGKRLMKLRKDKKLTLKQLGNETGLTPSYISSVEKGEVIPPVAVILQLSKALEIDSSLLLQAERKLAGKRREEDYRRRTDSYSYETLSPHVGNKRLKAFKVFIDPRSEHGADASYRHQGEEFQYVLKGRVEVMIGENRNVLEPGQSIHFDSSIAHKLRNLSSDRAELLVVLYTP